MGGKALTNGLTRRYNKDEFETIIPIIVEKAKTLFKDVSPLKYYRTKQNFGDADILCLTDSSINIDIKQWIYETYQSKEVSQNGNVYSFEFNELQVDFILTPLENWETSKAYFAWNDLGNLCGKIFHRFGLKYGHQGLVKPYRIDGKNFGDIIISKDVNKILEFGGFDAERFKLGFDTLEEIYQFVIDSKYFNPYVFDLDSLNAITRQRDKKRPVYKAFTDKIEHFKNDEYKDSFHYFYHDKKVYLGLIDYIFPGFLKEYRNLEKKEERKREVHKLFNGHILMKAFHINGKELGIYMGKFQGHFGSLENMENFILKTNDILEIIYIFANVNDLEIKNNQL